MGSEPQWIDTTGRNSDTGPRMTATGKREKMSWIFFLPYAALILLLVLATVSASRGRPLDLDRRLLYESAVYFIGSVAWYTVFLLVARFTSIWERLGSSLLRAAWLGAFTAAFVWLLGQDSSGGMFNMQDLFVMFPGMTVLELATQLGSASTD